MHAVPAWDGAGFHTAKAPKVPDNVTPLTPPPRSPELMPAETLWHSEPEHHRPSASTTTTRPCRARRGRAGGTPAFDPENVKSICAVPWLDERAK